MNTKIHTFNWNTIPYQKAWDEQEALFNETITEKLQGHETSNYLILCEHPHVFTLGKNGVMSNLLVNQTQLQAVQAEFIQTNRGGDITYHGPGQLVGYPIFDLDNFKLGLKQFIDKMETAIIEVLSQYDIQAGRMPKTTGVWLDVENPSRSRKICAIGVRSSHFVTMHGFALNVSTDLNYFSHINPCGFVDKGVTSMQQELGRVVPMSEVKKKIEKAFQRIFCSE